VPLQASLVPPPSLLLPPTYLSQGLRPALPEDLELPKTFTSLMSHCWNDNPEERPSFDMVSRALVSTQCSPPLHPLPELQYVPLLPTSSLLMLPPVLIPAFIFPQISPVCLRPSANLIYENNKISYVTSIIEYWKVLLKLA
jgi:hypothetical protein